MINLISRAVAHINSVLNQLQVKRFLAVVLAGFLVLTTNVANEGSSKAVTSKVNQALQQNDSQRPQTTGEWNKEARETEDAPGERLKRIAGQSAEAVKEFGSLYPDTARRSADSLQDNTK
ncbi:hypothetical protein [Brasilonema sp. UFV-L1]|uniref:hypothetical protein n=1 Tax=Brasilonema sp. UFV-L1 TaxID=2234130 RepID=UPI00145E9BAB|nr:hypothetical protein [Brasilonema sp. UFV-L1]NMG10726.1 hypothetical protein [Brasilonema sp. UFV-L1]